MIVLDTNVLSELLRAAPEPRVKRWIESQPAGALFTTTITQAEILLGVGMLPEGRKRSALTDAVRAIFNEDLAERVLPFDSDAALEFADIAARRRAIGRPISQLDAMIAATARSRGAALATRNVRDFEHCGIDVHDPWSAPASAR
ncbi:MAG: type II toxin-antitoxin system VapC family toxin [Steroidobacteraceae bacterium]